MPLQKTFDPNSTLAPSAFVSLKPVTDFNSSQDNTEKFWKPHTKCIIMGSDIFIKGNSFVCLGFYLPLM